MNRQHKVLFWIMALLCVISLCVIAAAADEAETKDPGMQPAQLLIMTYNNCRTEYNEGELFDTTGFRGFVSCYNPEYSFYIESSALTYLETEPLSRDVTEITFFYEDLTYKVPINVTPVEISGFEASASKTEFLALETIDPSVFTLERINADGTRVAVDPSACTFNPSIDEPISAYVKAITVTYSVGTATFSDVIEISVLPIHHIELEGIEGALLYEGMEPKLPAGLAVRAFYDEAGTVSATLTDFAIEYPYSAVQADENGKTTVTLVLDLQKIEAELPVASIVSYTITGFESAYYYGDSFSYSNAQITAVYGDGTKRDVTEEVQFGAPSIITVGSQITAIHNGRDLSQYLPFTLPEGKLTVVTSPEKLKYEVGEIFDSTGLTVAIEYSDGMRRMLAPTDYNLSVPAILTAKDTYVLLAYYGTTEKISITVGNDTYITNLFLIGTPDILSYYEGDLINIAGVVIEAYYSDGTKERIDPRNLTFTPSLTTPLTVDISEIKISVNDGTDRYCEVTYPITVKDKHPTALVPVSHPNKLQYAEGEKFDPDGLELRLYFNDGTFIVPSSYNFSPALGSTIILRSNATEKYIVHTTYEYEGETYTYPIEITVTPAEVENLLITRTPVKTVYEIGEQFDPTGLDIIIIYKDRSLAMSSIPEGYYTVSPSVITDTTKEIVFSFRGLSVSLPITVNGGVSSDETTETPTTPPETEPIITPPETSQNDVTSEITTQPPEVTTGPDESTTETPEVTTDPETTTAPETTVSPGEVTTSGDETTDPGNDDKKEPSSLLFLWIIVIVIIVAALVALIIYYKKNFT